MATVTEVDQQRRTRSREGAGKTVPGPPLLATAIPLAAAAGLWALTLGRTRPELMTDTGLVSVLPGTGFLALAVLAAGFGLVLAVRSSPGWLLTAHPILLALLLHTTTAVLYGTPRFSWTWKHAGIVEYIGRTGALDPDAEFLAVYHSWPGFFSFNAMLTEAAGLSSATSYAAWAEGFFNVLIVGAVVLVLRSLTDDPRTIAVGAWVFVLGNWVGQAYFAPQALALLWYLVLVALLLRWFPGTRATWSGVASTPGRRVGLMAVAVLLVAGTVSTHQLTPLVMVMTLAALALTRRLGSTVLPLLAAVLLAVWVLGVAEPYTAPILWEELAAVGAVDANVGEALIRYDRVSDGQRVVSLASRALTAAVVLLALTGRVMTLRRGQRHVRGTVLAAVPFLLVAVSSYGNEVLFRAYLFALVGLVYFVSLLLWPPGTAPGQWRGFVIVGLSLALMAGLLLAAFGNDRRYRFTAEETAAAEYVYRSAPPGTLLVEGSRNYPSQFLNYERFTYVPIAREPAEGIERLAADPETVLARWMSNDDYAAAYLIITRSQIAETDALGEIPGGLAAIEERLLESSAFRAVFHNDHATVFVLREEP